MLAAAPIPTAVPKPAPTAGPAAPGATPPAGAAAGAAAGSASKVDDAPAAPAGQAADGAKQQAPAPNGGAAPVDAAAAKQAIIEKLQTTTASDAIAQVDDHLAKLSMLSVGGGTPEGQQSTKAATSLLTDSSMLLQHAHVKAMEQLRDMATELQMRVMSSVSGLAYMGGQVAMAGQSKTPVKLSEIAAGPINETKAIMADVIAAITPKAPADAAGAAEAPPVAAPGADAPPPADSKAPQGAPASAPAPDAKSVPVPNAPNGNTGVAGGVKVPGGLQHVTPGPGAGRGPNPA
ncbi:MAG: hypothetical protein JWL76_1403 [Thermoleophilia bacterium]|nr:hypothetical protein [Thermoleophilia bacterium]